MNDEAIVKTFVSLLVVSLLMVYLDPYISQQLALDISQATPGTAAMLEAMRTIFSLHIEIIGAWVAWVSSLFDSR